MRAKVIAPSLIIDGVEQEVGTVIEVSEGLCKRSLKLEPAGKVTTRASGRPTKAAAK